MRRVAALVVAVTFVALACEPIVGTPPAAVPRNECPAHFCEAYTQEGTKPQCSAGRCEAGKPTYPYVLVVDVPTTSFFGAGRTFVLDSRVFVGAKGTSKCPALNCLQLPPLATVQTSLGVDKGAASALGLKVPSMPSAPAAALTTFILLPPGDRTEKRTAQDIGIPVVDFASDLAVTGAGIPASSAEIAPGRYERIVMPQDPDVPPIVSSLDRIASEEIVIGSPGYALDELPNGKTRLAHLSRTGGLDGFRVWLEDAVTETRLSTLHTLSGETAIARADTVNQNEASVLRANVNIVVAPPLGSVGIPTLKNGILQGTGFEPAFPALPPPATVRGTVVSPSGAQVSGTVVLDSQQIALTAPDKPVSFLRYRSTLQTDPQGAFATVLPPGSYSVTVIPSAGASLAPLRATTVTIAGDVQLAPFVTNELSRVSGRALLSDGRPVSFAEVVAQPSLVQPDHPDARKRLRPWLFPREARTVTGEDGSFVIRAEEGTFDFVVIPQPGTGFGRTVSPSRKVSPPLPSDVDGGSGDGGARGNDLGTLVVPAPLKVAFTIHDPSDNVIPQAVVRALTLPTGHAEYVEIGSALTNAQGQFEILLGPVPR